jgi:signal transduction histidine kinase
MAGREAVITVRDSGRGMPPDILERAAEPFFSTAANGTGRGLGLPIVARVIRDLGGRMTLEAQPGAGCCVRLILPCA